MQISPWSKLRKRAPDAFQTAMDGQFEGDPALRIPAQDFVNYFHEQKMDPTLVAHQLGVTNLEEAAAAGSDLEIPKANYFARLDPEHARALLPDVVDPASDLTARQAGGSKAELRQFMSDPENVARLQAEYAQADSETQATPEWKAVHDELKQRYMSADVKEPVAEHVATINANVYANLARETGMSPSELMAMREPNVVAGEAPGLAGTTDVLHQSFVPAPDGLSHFGEITPEIALSAGMEPGILRLTPEGKQHIDDNRGESIRERFGSIENFVHYVGRNFDAIYDTASTREGKAYDIVVNHPSQGGKLGRLVVRVEEDPEGKYYDVRTVMEPRKDQFKNKKPLWERTGTSPSSSPVEGQNPLGPKGQSVESSVPRSETEVNPDVLYQGRKEELDARRQANLESARAQGELIHGEAVRAGEPQAVASMEHLDRLLVHNNWGAPGQEFTATMGSEVLKPGDIVGENTQGVALKVVGLEGKTSQGAQWYKFQTVDADASRAAGENVTPNARGKSARELLGSGDKPTTESQAASAGVRGWFRAFADGRFEIGKTKLGDVSTLIHEPAHAYLELFRTLTQREGASEVLKNDFRKICDWLGTTAEEAYKNGFTTDQHEQWAKANEKYVMEGVAPSSGLAKAFQQFSEWLTKIYKRADALGVEISPEVRGVMDRLYAGEDAVNRAAADAPQRLYESPEAAGWTEEEYRNYAESLSPRVRGNLQPRSV